MAFQFLKKNWKNVRDAFDKFKAKDSSKKRIINELKDLEIKMSFIISRAWRSPMLKNYLYENVT
jgi:hypothetical protein